jgi:tetratricopeptide (TPR) repeat protein
MIDVEAKKRKYCVVRIELDEADATSQLSFFYKLFDSLLTSACGAGAFSGLHGKTYEAYRNTVDAAEIPSDKTFSPFIFPLQYALAQRSNGLSRALSDTGYKRDLALIADELNRPVLIVIDEADVLSQSRVLLQKLRNVFMNCPRYMLVLTGTPTLFPLIDEVFSPIVRQFKKISVTPFNDREDTADCIRKPLEKVGVHQPARLFDRETFHDVAEIHDLSGGRPYEIQLICHVLFRRIQEGRATRMELSVDVLDDVLSELGTLYDVAARPIINIVRNLTTPQLRALNRLSRTDGLATFEHIWACEYMCFGTKRWTREALENHLRQFEQIGILRTDSRGFISFAGDDFDRIYCKYFAKKQKAVLSIERAPLGVALAIAMRSIVSRGCEELDCILVDIAATEELRLSKALGLLLEDTGTHDPFESDGRDAETLYRTSIKFRNRATFEIARVVLSTPWARVSGCYVPCYLPSKECCAGSCFVRLGNAIQDAETRALEVGASATVNFDTARVVPLDLLIGKLARSGNSRLREEIAFYHVDQMVNAYTKAHDRGEAKFHAELAYRLLPTGGNTNNYGYLSLVDGDRARARELLIEALGKGGEHLYPVEYNLGVMELMEGNYVAARERFNTAAEEANRYPSDERQMMCLLVPELTEGEALTFPERLESDLLVVSEEAKRIVEQLIDAARTRTADAGPDASPAGA